jgi:aminoglycoside phosphotransferase (APT) family kinase protein
MTDLDQPTPVRADATFDVGALTTWLRQRDPTLEGTPELFQFGKGFSNLTYLARYALPAQRELVIRRAPPGIHIKSAHDMGREFRILRALAPIWPKVPKPVAYCEDEGVIGSEFYAMNRVEGVILRARRADAGPPERDGLGPAAMRRVSEAWCDTLAEIHSLDWRAAGLESLGKPAGYIERQVRGWSDRWRKSRTDDVPEMERLGAWLDAHRPAADPGPAAATLVHNDFKYDNVVFAPDLGRVVAVLDWEMATLGDPLMDLGTALGYWIEAGDPPILYTSVAGPTNLPGNLTRMEIVERWSRATGRDASNVTFYYAFALFKLGIIKQQLYKRWVEKLTGDERFAAMLEGVRAVSTAALLAVEKGRIDRLAG